MDASETKSSTQGAAKVPRGFWALIATQFQGAFNDNLFQYTIIYFLIALYAADEKGTAQINSIAGIVFSLPFIIFPGIFGALSDRYSKRTITIWAKYIEIAVMTLGAIGFFFRLPEFLWVMLFLMAAQSAFFSPSKYGILPEILPESRLSWGNGILALFTMVSIIAGIGVAGPLFTVLGKERAFGAGLLLMALSTCGTLSSYGITRVPPADPTKRIPVNPLEGMWTYTKFFLHNRLLLVTLIGYTYFWFAGKYLQANLMGYAKFTMNASDTTTSIILAVLALGIGIGSFAAGYFSRGRIEFGLVPIGLIGIGISTALLAFSGLSTFTCFFLFVSMGFWGGFFSVPLAAALQERSPAEAKGRILALVNVMTFLGMAFASLLFWALSAVGLGARGVFLVGGLLSLGLCAFMCIAEPHFLVRFILSVMTNTFYRVRVVGAENIPPTGGALLIANHISFMDPGVVQAAVDRPIRYLGYRGYYDVWWMKPIMKLLGVIPVAATDGPGELSRSLGKAGEIIARGELVCIFPEGGITRTGQMQSFQKGYQRILKDVDVPIIPMHIDNAWGSVFSFSGGRFFLKWPKAIPLTLQVSIGKPMPATSTPFELRQAVTQLEADAWMLRRRHPDLLHRVFVKVARRHMRLPAMADARTGALSYFRALAGSIILGRKLKHILDKQSMVGLLVPPSVGAGLANIALQMMGRVPVNLNYTAGDQTLKGCAQRCHMTHCITAHAFLDRMPVEVPATPIFLEDVMKSVTKKDRIVGMLLALFCPTRILEKLLGSSGKRSCNDIATVIFSSGSEGVPKGVILTHFNVMSNIDSMEQVVPYRPKDVIIGFLPLFHSFGFTACFWAPVLNQMMTAFHPNPLETKAIAGLIHKHKARFLVSTPTFLQSFIRKCTPEELSSLELVVCGAEKLQARIRQAFKEKFGIEPLDGYGATECSPLISLCIPDFRIPNYRVVLRGTKLGSVGRTIPGVCARVVDTDTGELLGQDQAGLLQVKGPNVMQGYLGMPEKTASILKNGWYTTGDIASIDEDGFITITDRLARFSKIAGEMVPHMTIEETLHGILGLTEQSLAVAGVHDDRFGERLVVLHTLSDEQLNELTSKLDQSGLPNLWRPKPDSFFKIEAIPVLGTGKMDIKTVKAKAEEFVKA